MMEKKYARLAALLAAAVLCGNGAPSMADDLVGNAKDGWSIVIDNGHDGNVYGNKDTPNTTTNAVTGHVKMTGGTVTGQIYGGWADDTADVKDSTVTINDGTVGGDVYGGWGYTDATNNRVTITGGTVGTVDSSSSVYGGYSSSSGYGGEVSGNTVTITGGKVTGYVYGGRISVGAATGNRVTITDGTVNDGIYGGCSDNGGVATGNTVTITGGTVGTVDSSRSVYGGCSNAGAATGNRVTITDGTVNNGIYGGWGYKDATNNRVTITGGTVGTVDSSRSVYGGYSDMGAATGNTVTISDGTVSGDVYGGYSWNGSGEVSGNTVALSGSANVMEARLYGSNKAVTGYDGNTLLINGWSGTVKSLHNFDAIDFENIDLSHETKLEVTEALNGSGAENAEIRINSLKAGDYAAGETKATAVTWDTDLTGKVTVADDVTKASRLFGDRDGGGIYMNDVKDTMVTHKTGTNTVGIQTYIDKSVLTGQFIDENGAIHQNSTYEGDTPQTLVIGDGFVTNAGTVAGVYDASEAGKGAAGGSVLINGSTDWTGTVYGGYSEAGAATGNTVYVGGYDETDIHPAEAGGVTVVGGYSSGAGGVSGNTLAVTGNGNMLKGISGMSSIDFQQVAMAKETEDSTAALTLSDTNGVDLGGTSLHVSSLAGGNTYAAGDHVTLLSAEHGITSDNGPVDVEKITAGVTQDLSVETTYGEDNKSIGLEVRSVSLNPQTDLIAENRAVAAAFVNQGADIAADSLRLLDDGYHYGTQTFGAVYGNRSTYDVASDIKINGWSEIAGFGNIHEVKGGRLAWGVFYENGTGNYRTWNTFNNEMFRGDGSLLYNGGGAAIRYTKDSGVYYEASLRAGTLSSSMSNAVKDGNGNSYGFDSDSTYWGAHVGAGKLIQRGSGQWDIYGKYFHTDIDGDSFEMGGDRFSFDSVTSDRLRLGARYTADTDKAWSLYCGAAYEYEFSGDSHMKAGQFEAPEQSLQGSTVFGEIGTVWGRKDSPWSMDINLRGYAGEREGFSGMVQLAYAF